MSSVPHIAVYDGKYTLIFDPGNMRALRYGEPWRDLAGDGFVMALGQEILDLKEKLKELADALEPLHVRGKQVLYLDTRLLNAFTVARLAE